MKVVIKLVIAALIVHATWRAGTVYWRYYKLKDGVQATSLFSDGKSEGALQNRVIDIAGELGVPLIPENVTVRFEPNHTIVDAVYSENIEILPTYLYPWEFKLHVDTFTVNMLGRGSNPVPQGR